MLRNEEHAGVVEIVIQIYNGCDEKGFNKLPNDYPLSVQSLVAKIFRLRVHEDQTEQ